jgi:WD40 repeat protein
MSDLGDDVQAEQFWDRAGILSPGDPTGVFNRGLVAWRQGKLSDSSLLEQLNDCQNDGSDVTYVSYLKALIHLERGDCRSASDDLSSTTESPRVSADAISSARIRAKTECDLTRSLAIEIDAHKDAITAVRIKHDGGTALTCSTDYEVKTWDISREPSPIFTFRHYAPVIGAGVASDWLTAVSIDADATLKHWDLNNGQQLRTFQTGHKSPAKFVAAGQDRTTCVTGDPGGVLKVWNLTKVTKSATCNCPAQRLSALFFRSDSDLVIAFDSFTNWSWQPSTGKIVGARQDQPPTPPLNNRMCSEADLMEILERRKDELLSAPGVTSCGIG